MNQKLENLYLPTNGVIQGSPTPRRCTSTGLQRTGNQATQTSKGPTCGRAGGRHGAKPCPPPPVHRKISFHGASPWDPKRLGTASVDPMQLQKIIIIPFIHNMPIMIELKY